MVALLKDGKLVIEHHIVDLHSIKQPRRTSRSTFAQLAQVLAALVFLVVVELLRTWCARRYITIRLSG